MTLRRGPHPFQIPLEILIKNLYQLWDGIMMIDKTKIINNQNQNRNSSIINYDFLNNFDKTSKIIDILSHIVLLYANGREKWQGEHINSEKCQILLLELIN